MAANGNTTQDLNLTSMEKVYPEWEEALALERYNARVIKHEFDYQGVPIEQTTGKNDVDFILPDGRTIEWKFDIRSQCTGSGAIEWKSLQRRADLYGYTFTYNRLYTYQELEFLYLHQGKKVEGGFGNLDYDGRYVRGMGKAGIPGYQFINGLKLSAREIFQ